MKRTIRCAASVGALLCAGMFSGVLAQDAKGEKHVEGVRAERQGDTIAQSAICQQARSDGLTVYRSPARLSVMEKDLSSLVQKSDEVLLTGPLIDNVGAPSPSGDEVVTFYDAVVLQTYKGSHKPGDVITFMVPEGIVSCGPGVTALTIPAHVHLFLGPEKHPNHYPSGPFVLFLRRSQADKSPFAKGFGLAGGSGVQGMFFVYESQLVRPQPGQAGDCFCAAIDHPVMLCSPKIDYRSKCNAEVASDSEQIEVSDTEDPLAKLYSGTTLATFLQDVKLAVAQDDQDQREEPK